MTVLFFPNSTAIDFHIQSSLSLKNLLQNTVDISQPYFRIYYLCELHSKYLHSHSNIKQKQMPHNTNTNVKL